MVMKFSNTLTESALLMLLAGLYCQVCLGKISLSLGSGQNLQPPENTTCPELGCKDPDVKRNAAELIKSRGFEVEEYEVTTKDGYILIMQRIINPEIHPDYRSKLMPVFLQHGLEVDSTAWILASPNVRPRPFPAPQPTEPNITCNGEDLNNPNALGYHLANLGYDTFLGNTRGNRYARGHVSKPPPNPLFWNFTYDEMIDYDLPAMIAKIQEVTNKKKMAYVGHSQGTLIMFGLLSDYPEYADIIEPYIALAPVSYLTFFDEPLRPILEALNPAATFVDAPFLDTPINDIVPCLCDSLVTREALCNPLYDLIFSYDNNNFDQTRYSVALSKYFSGTSLRSFVHFAQATESLRVPRYDFGPVVNLERYGQLFPPEYNLSNIRLESIYLFASENDFFADPLDVQHLRDTLTVDYEFTDITPLDPFFNHIDYVLGKNTGLIINTRVGDILIKYRDY